MARLARKDLPSPFLHIIVQGINREYIFKENKLKLIYKSMLKKNLLNTSIKILAYCIMDNHAHILMYSENINEISQVMLKTNTSYAMLYNRNNHRVGYVFRSRYYTQSILNEHHLFNCISYIHQNPSKAGIVKDFSEYKYSSYLEFLYKKDLITSESIKLIFGSSEKYIDTFNEIHKIEDIEDIKDIIEDFQDPYQVINKYLEHTSKTLQEIKQDSNLLAELLIQLRHTARSFFKRYGKTSKYT